MNTLNSEPVALLPLTSEWLRTLAGRTIVRMQCAWCGGESASSSDVPETAAISHGICRPCAQRHFGIDPASATDR